MRQTLYGNLSSVCCSARSSPFFWWKNDQKHEPSRSRINRPIRKAMHCASMFVPEFMATTKQQKQFGLESLWNDQESHDTVELARTKHTQIDEFQSRFSCHPNPSSVQRILKPFSFSFLLHEQCTDAVTLHITFINAL
mmetsp:Transcript_4806/g.8387  ORF Transcript_4806/g.8387 Transcript_4806/m.8387 type:complete len:138 (+) Transcript_4806:142-555(+)